MNVEEIVYWDCPLCGARNTDFRNQTALPMCEACDEDVDWDDIPNIRMHIVSLDDADS